MLMGQPDCAVNSPRREFLRKGAWIGTLSGLAGLSLITGCKGTAMEDITPVEDLMREHGVLNRIMLVYDACRLKLVNGEPFPMELLYKSAQIIRSFIEDYHEMLEEKFLFPRFINANKMVDQVQLLYVQHHAGRVMTDQILQLANSNALKSPDDSPKLISLLEGFNQMYRPHEAREDTDLFPVLRKIVSRNEYLAMGEDFEKKENELFGSDGFGTCVNKVADIEKQLGINDMTVFTPAV
jgi:hemerythrin-like domain-containing protein